ncbi:hypothetical protein [Allorhizocola rhizosphaerae]|uniref:hypothetical protein n=1 Tax=Allorhizocola rhizosphaerae TaxID=1872709 RepID=UPI000E3BE20F|nr:hypothetical protein [Allorhizocola rhizosphaerae]
MGVSRLYDGALFAWGAAAASALAAKGIHDVRATDGWPRGLELAYAAAVVVAVVSVVLAGVLKLRLRARGTVLADEGTADTHRRSMAAATYGALTVQLPFFFGVQVSSIAQAQFTVAGALLCYGAARLWLGREH